MISIGHPHLLSSTAQGPTNSDSGKLIEYAAPMLFDHASGTLSPIAPTLRFRAGKRFVVNYHNNLTYPPGTVVGPFHGSGFHDPFAT